MELLYLTDRLSHRGGAPHHLLDLIRVMAEEHQVTVAAADKDRDVACLSTCGSSAAATSTCKIPRVG